MKKNFQLEKLLNEIASEAIWRRLMRDPQRIDREDISRLFPKHAAILLRRHPELREFFKGRRAIRGGPATSGRDSPPMPCNPVPKSPGS